MTEYIVKCNEVVGISGKALIVPDYIDTSKEVVRCRDCKYVPFFDGFGDGWCSQNCHGVKALDYCVWGKRKEGGE